jgi:acetyl-CoA carboxylase biotin carboxyl carrier protein
MKNKGKKSDPAPASPAQVPQKPLSGELLEIESLLSLLERHGVAEFEQQRKDQTLRIRFQSDQGHAASHGVTPIVVGHAPAPHAHAPAGTAAYAAASTAPSTAPASRPAPVMDGTVVFKSPMVGTFYRSPSPEAESFVKKRDRVGPDTTLCIIEAMKVMNEIKAELDAEVVDILVENGQAIEFGQPLFVLKPG